MSTREKELFGSKKQKENTRIVWYQLPK